MKKSPALTKGTNSEFLFLVALSPYFLCYAVATWGNIIVDGSKYLLNDNGTATLRVYGGTSSTAIIPNIVGDESVDYHYDSH